MRAVLDHLRPVARTLLQFEPFAWLLVAAMMWPAHHDRIWALPVIGLVVLLRTLAYGITPLSRWEWALIGVFTVFFALGLINILVAPYSWSPVTLQLGGVNIQVNHTFVFLTRPVFGLFIVLSLPAYIRRARTSLRMRETVSGTSTDALNGLLAGVVAGTTVLAGVLVVFGLYFSQWANKSADFQPFLRLLPTLAVPGSFIGGMNVNEIGGALAWITPLTAALAIGAWQIPAPARLLRIRRVGFTTLLGLLILALFLGQSRLALIGIIVAIAGVITLLIPRGRVRVGSYIVLAAFALLQVLIFARIGSPQANALIARDESSFSTRIYIWQSGLLAVRDYPLTGLGVGTFRHPDVRTRYPVPGYPPRILPHAHNEVIQMAVDLGLPGIAVYIAFYSIAAAAVWRGWRGWRGWKGNAIATPTGTDTPRVRPPLTWMQVLAVGAGAALVAHLIFGLADNISPWDRLAFVGWWMIGLACASAVAVEVVQAQESAVAPRHDPHKLPAGGQPAFLRSRRATMPSALSQQD